MSLTEILLAIIALAAVIGVVAIHFHFTSLTALVTDAKNLFHLQRTTVPGPVPVAPAAPAPANVSHVVTVNNLPASPVAPVATIPTPTPQTPNDWPAGSGEISGSVVPNTKLPGYQAGGPALSFAAQLASYASYTQDVVNQLTSDPRFAARGFVWQEDGPNGRAAYVA